MLTRTGRVASGARRVWSASSNENRPLTRRSAAAAATPGALAATVAWGQPRARRSRGPPTTQSGGAATWPARRPTIGRAQCAQRRIRSDAGQRPLRLTARIFRSLRWRVPRGRSCTLLSSRRCRPVPAATASRCDAVLGPGFAIYSNKLMVSNGLGPRFTADWLRPLAEEAPARPAAATASSSRPLTGPAVSALPLRQADRKPSCHPAGCGFGRLADCLEFLQ